MFVPDVCFCDDSVDYIHEPIETVFGRIGLEPYHWTRRNGIGAHGWDLGGIHVWTKS